MGLPSYVINFDELVNALKDYLTNGIKVDIPSVTVSTANLESILSDIESKIQGVDYNQLIAALNALGVKLDSLGNNLGLSGTQKVQGEMLQIPASVGQYSINFPIPASGSLTDVTYSLSAWNYQDTWDLSVGGVQLFTNVTTKEYGENKHFENFYKTNSSDVITLTYNNNSGSARILWADFAVLET